MFIGHFGVGFAAKRAAVGPSLGTYVAAAELPDFLWAVFVLLGWEQVCIAPGDTVVTPLRFTAYPLSHSLLADLGWASGAGGLYWLWSREARASIWIGLLVVSHWILDVISHRPDVPLAPGSELVLGLGLWNSLPATALVEGGIFAIGLALYVRATRARSRAGRYGLGAFVALLAALYAGSLLGPPPPSVEAIAATNIIAVSLIRLAAWVDRARDPSLDHGRRRPRFPGARAV